MVTDVLIEGERGNPEFLPWLENAAEAATAGIARGEFLFLQLYRGVCLVASLPLGPAFH